MWGWLPDFRTFWQPAYAIYVHLCIIKLFKFASRQSEPYSRVCYSKWCSDAEEKALMVLSSKLADMVIANVAQAKHTNITDFFKRF